MADKLTLKIEVQDDGSAVIKDFKGNVRQLGDDVQQSSGKAQSGFSKMKTSVDDFGKSAAVQFGAAGALAGITAIVTKSITSLATFNDKMIDVQKTTEMSSTEIKTLGDSLREMATNDLKGMVAAETLAEISEQAGQMGTRGIPNLQQFSKAVAMMDVATDLSATQAAESLGDLKAAFKEGLEASGKSYESFASNIGSSMNALSAENNATVGHIMEITRRISGASGTMKLSIDQAAGLAATIKDSGIGIEVGGTAISKFMLKLAEDSDKFAETFDINSKKLAESLQTDPMEAIKMVLEGMDSLGDSKGPGALSAALNETVGSDTRLKDAMLKLSSATVKLDENLKTSAEEFKKNTSLQDEFANKAESNVSKWQGIGEKSKEVFRSFGEELKPAPDLLTDWASGGLDTVIKSAKAWQGGIKDEFFDVTVEQFSGLSEKISGAWNGLKSKPAEISGWFKDLDLGDWTTGTSEKLTSFFTGLESKPGTITGWFKDLDLGDWTAITKEAFDGFVKDLQSAPADIVKLFSGIDEKILDAFAGLKDGIAQKLSGLLDGVPSPVKKLLGIEGQPETTVLSIDASSALQSLKDLNQEYQILGSGNQALMGDFRNLASGLQTAMAEGIPVSQELIAQFEQMQEQIKAVGVEAYGSSTFPDMTAAMQTSQSQAQALTAEMTTMSAEVVALDEAHRNAAKEEKEAIRSTLDGLHNKKGEIQNEISLLKEQAGAQKESVKVAKDAVKAQEERVKAAEWLAKQQEKSASAMQKHLQEEKQENQRILEMQRDRARESLKFIDQLSEGAKDRLLGEEDVVEALEEQGVILSDMQQEELLSIQRAHQKEQALEQQTAELERQLMTSEEIGGVLSETIGSLSGNIGQLGDLFGFDTGGIQDALGMAQEIAEFPAIISEVKGSIGGMKDAFSGIGDLFEGGFGGLKDLFSGGFDMSGILGSLGSLIPGVGSLIGAIGPLKDVLGSVWEGIKGLFGDTKSKGTEAAESWQQFVAESVSGGAEMSAALKASFSEMSAAGFNYQTFLESAGAGTQELHHAFGGLAEGTALGMLAEQIGEVTGSAEKGNQIALQTIDAWADMGLSAEEAAAKMLEMAEASGMSGAELEELRAALGATGEAAAALDDTEIEIEASVSDVEIPDVDAPELEIDAKVNTGALQQGLSTITGMIGQAKAAMGEGDILGLDQVDMTGITAQLQALRTQGVMTAADLGSITGIMQQIGADGAVSAAELSQLEAALGGVQGQLAATGGAGSSASSGLNNAKTAANGLKTGMTSLSGSMAQTVGQLQAFTSQGTSTQMMLGNVDMSARQLDMTTQQLNADTQQFNAILSQTGMDTMTTATMFDEAGLSAQTLQGDMSSLVGEAGSAEGELQSVADAVDAIPNKKIVTIEIRQVGGAEGMATGGVIGTSGMAIVNERGPEIARFPSGTMALMTQPGPVLGAFPVGTEIIPHDRSMSILREYPHLPRMASGGTIAPTPTGVSLHIGNITIQGTGSQAELRKLADDVGDRIARKVHEQLRRRV